MRFGAGGGTRTLTPENRDLNPARLPVPPRPRRRSRYFRAARARDALAWPHVRRRAARRARAGSPSRRCAPAARRTSAISFATSAHFTSITVISSCELALELDQLLAERVDLVLRGVESLACWRRCDRAGPPRARADRRRRRGNAGRRRSRRARPPTVDRTSSLRLPVALLRQDRRRGPRRSASAPAIRSSFASYLSFSLAVSSSARCVGRRRGSARRTPRRPRPDGRTASARWLAGRVSERDRTRWSTRSRSHLGPERLVS